MRPGEISKIFENSPLKPLKGQPNLGHFARKIHLKVGKTSFSLHFFNSLGVRLQYKTTDLTSPNLIIPFDYNLLFLVVDHANIVCPTTFMVKFFK